MLRRKVFSCSKAALLRRSGCQGLFLRRVSSCASLRTAVSRSLLQCGRRSFSLDATNAEKFKETRLSEYKPPPFAIDTIKLTVDIQDSHVIVTNDMELSKLSSESFTSDGFLKLDGDLSMKCEGVFVDGSKLEAATQYTVCPLDGCLLVSKTLFPKATAKLRVVTKIDPFTNKSCEGFYQCGTGHLNSGSGPLLITQCEAQGFRKVTYSLDRPDSTSIFSTLLLADACKYPTTVANGDCVSRKLHAATGKEHALFVDKWKKPTYLFAMVCGDLHHLEDEFEGVRLFIHCEKHVQTDKLKWAMKSLKMAMEWDKKVFGLEYDCSEYHIVVADHFNMGAMENKGLNIFNSRYVVCDEDGATDEDFMNVLRVVAHEYFHNYTGNRVTLRDWFQLSLKEGLTVYREQEFYKDVCGFRGVARVDAVRQLQHRQFKEDSGAMSHAVRPQKYVEINNFYTATVYEKGAEVIRVMEAIVGGRKPLVAAVKDYLAKHDGDGVTLEDFVTCLKQSVAQASVRQRLDAVLATWYSVAGTPEVVFHSDATHYDADSKTLRFTLSQNCNEAPSTHPIPLKFALLSRDQSSPKNLCRRLPLFVPKSEAGSSRNAVDDELHSDESGGDEFVCVGLEHTLFLDSAKKEFILGNVTEPCPMVSLNREFSAPVYVRSASALEDLLMQSVRDVDPYSRWEASNKLLSVACIDAYNSAHNQLANGRSADERSDADFALPPSSDKARECLQRTIAPFVPRKVMAEMKQSLSALRKKEMLRKRRSKRIVGGETVPEQFLLDDFGKEAHSQLVDATHEVFLEDVIGEEQGGDALVSGSNPLLAARQLAFPSFDYLAPLIAASGRELEPVLLQSAILHLRAEASASLFPHFSNSYQWARDQLSALSLQPSFGQSLEGLCVGRAFRALLNASLSYLMADFGLGTDSLKSNDDFALAERMCLEQYQLARNMTEMLGALRAATGCVRPSVAALRSDLLAHFFKHFGSEPLVTQRWFELQALSPSDDCLKTVIALLEHPAYDSSVPNCVYSLVAAFATGNPLNFHRADGHGYHFVASQVLFHERTNPAVAARLCKAFACVDALDSKRVALIGDALHSILASDSLSKGSYEVCTKIMDQIENR